MRDNHNRKYIPTPVHNHPTVGVHVKRATHKRSRAQARADTHAFVEEWNDIRVS